MEVSPTSVALIIRALVVSALWAGRSRQSTLEEMTAAAETNRVAELEARVATLEDTVELRDAHLDVLESRLGEKRPRKPYPLMERLRIIWLMEYSQIPQRRLENTLGVSRPSVRRWLKAFERGSLGMPPYADRDSIAAKSGCQCPVLPLYFTPTGCSWLSLVERWSHDLATKRIRQDESHGVSDLIAAIQHYLPYHNRQSRPFMWAVLVETILAKVGRCEAVLETAH